MSKNKVIEEKLSVLPHLPGVYIMKNSSGSIIYVGKSKNLKNRVSSYFQSPEKLSIKTKKLSNNITDFDIILTHNEAEALILENELIKKHLPKYNIKLKDSKTYPYIKITNENYPRLLTQYERKDDKCKYFGPYTSATAARDIIKTVQKTFKLPNCEKKLVWGKAVGRPCLNYHIDQCIAPCTGKISKENYSDIFDEIALVLKGDYTLAEKSLTEKMQRASEDLQFEVAAKYRDSINHLKKLSDQQKIKSAPGRDKDIFGFYEQGSHSCITILLVRDGSIIDKNVIFINADEMTDNDDLSGFVFRYYSNSDYIPKEIYISFDIDNTTLNTISEYLSKKAGHNVIIHTPVKGINKNLCNMACDNACEAIKTKIKQEENDNDLLIRLAQLLKLEVVPERIESYDISNSADTDIYCGMIVVENGKFKKSDYRAFSIKTTCGVNDYGAMSEALTRRFSHIGTDKNNKSLFTMPDLILLDGGIGQVSVVKEIARKMNIHVPIFGMVKDKFHKTRTITDGENEIGIAKDSLIFSFIYKIQEEVHRFTFSKMDSSRRKKMKKLELTSIKGIGEAKAKALYKNFKTLDSLKNASIDELCSVKGITKEIAENIISHLNTEKEKLQ